MTRPVLVDLFCGAGGAAAGYAAAGFEVIGVDIEDQPRYPGRFIRRDVTELTAADILALGATAVHASPPCQRHSRLAHFQPAMIADRYADLVAPTRELLRSTGRPYVLENVPGAPLLDPVVLCGQMFGLRMYRHRLFETSFLLVAPTHPRHVELVSRGGNMPTARRPFFSVHGGKHDRAWQRAAAAAMDVPWVALPADADAERARVGIRELCEAIPPRFTECVGAALMTSGRSARRADDHEERAAQAAPLTAQRAG